MDIAGIVDRVAILRGGKLAYCGAPVEMQEWVYLSVFLSAVVMGLISYLAMMRLADSRYRDIHV